MNRLGMNLQEIKNLSDKEVFKNINIKFIMSHFTCAEDINNLINKIQLEKLLNCAKILKKIYKQEIKTSICNSSGIWLGAKYLLDVIRPGAAFLGINPTLNKENPLKEVLSLYAQITQIKRSSKN